MRYILMTFVGTDHAAAWERATPQDRQAEVDRTIAWFREHGAAGRIVGGEELAMDIARGRAKALLRQSDRPAGRCEQDARHCRHEQSFQVSSPPGFPILARQALQIFAG